jgi:O-antigen/teichoic acid export membrane protein
MAVVHAGFYAMRQGACMLKRIVTVFIGDGFSKALNIGVSLYLISLLAIDQYAYFTVVFTSIMMGYQVACGLIERLYITDHVEFTVVARRSILLIAVPIGCIFFAYTVAVLGGKAGLVFMLGYAVFICFQILRIAAQKDENFRKFVTLDIMKNGVWAALTVALVLLGAKMADYFLVALIFSAWIVVLCTNYSVSRPHSRVETGRIGGVIQAFSYLKTRTDIVFYSILAGCMPYIALVLASFMTAVETVATYGVAMRYQALFSMVVYAVNVVLLPRMANGNATEMKQVISAFYSKLPYMLLGVTIAGCAVWFVIPMLGTEKYPGAQVTFAIFAGCSLCSLVSAPAATYLLALRRYRDMLKSICLGLASILVTLPVMLFLSDFYGVALACAFGYLCSGGALLLYTKKDGYENTHY